MANCGLAYFGRINEKANCYLNRVRLQNGEEGKYHLLDSVNLSIHNQITINPREVQL